MSESEEVTTEEVTRLMTMMVFWQVADIQAGGRKKAKGALKGLLSAFDVMIGHATFGRAANARARAFSVGHAAFHEVEVVNAVMENLESWPGEIDPGILVLFREMLGEQVPDYLRRYSKNPRKVRREVDRTLTKLEKTYMKYMAEQRAAGV